MTVSPVVLGYEAQVLVKAGGGVFFNFAVRGCTTDADADEHECGDSITGIFKAHKGGRRHLAISLEFQEYHGTVMHVPPNNFVEGTEISISVFPNGPGEPGYICPSFILKHYQDRWNIDGKLEGSLSGKSNGPYTLPGQ